MTTTHLPATAPDRRAERLVRVLLRSWVMAAALACVANPASACTPTPNPQRDWPAESPAEQVLDDAFVATDKADDQPAAEAAARAWLAHREGLGIKGDWFVAYILERLAMAQGIQGESAEALAGFTRAYDLWSKAFGADSPEARGVGVSLGIAQFKAGRIDAARATLKAVSKAADAMACPDSDEALGVLRTWGQTAGQGDAAEAAEVWGEYAARRLRRFGQDDPDLALAEAAQGEQLIKAARAAEALPVLERAAQRYERLGGAKSAAALMARAHAAQALLLTGRFREAEARAKAVIDAAGPALGAKAEVTLFAEEIHLNTLIAQGAYDRAPPTFEALMAARMKAFGADDGWTMNLVEIGADLYGKLDQFQAAEALRRTALAYAVRTQGPDSQLALDRLDSLAALLVRSDRADDAERLLAPIWARIGAAAKTEVELEIGQQLAAIYLAQERNADAEPLLRELSVRAARLLGAQNATTLYFKHDLAISIGRRGRMAESESLLREVWAGWTSRLGPAHPTTIMAGLDVAQSIVARDRVQERVGLISQLSDALDAAGQTGSASDVQLRIMSTMGRELMRYGQYADAEKIWSQIRAGYVRLFGVSNPRTRSATMTLARALGEQHKHAEAEALFVELAGAEERAGGARATLSSDWITAQAGIGLSRTLLGRPREGYPALARAVQAVNARSADRGMSGARGDEQRRVLTDNRYVFLGAVRSGWAFAHEP